MGQGVTAFLAGVLVFQHMPDLPSAWWGMLLPLLPVLGGRYPAARIAAWCAGGFLWALIHANHVLSTALPADLEGRDLWVEGTVATVPEHRARAVRFQFRIERLNNRAAGHITPLRVRLNWYGAPPALRAGDRWRLRVRLKRPHGFMNPGGFDYEGWLYRNGIRATGYVRPGESGRRLGQNEGYWLPRLRQRLGDRIRDGLGGREFGGVITALAIGDRQGVPGDQWEVLTRTGTSHLTVISGLHVGLVSGLVFFAARSAWARMGRLPLRLPAPQAASVAAMAAAVVYAALAGFSVPTQRALIMVAVVMTAVLARRQHAPSHTLMTALLFVLLYDPLAVMSGGFWLSFSAVAVILFGMAGRAGPGGWWWRWGRVHVLIGIGLAPVMLILFQQVPLAAPVANLVAVPWVTLVVVPLVLGGLALLPWVPAAAGHVLRLADTLFGGLWPLLERIAAWDAAQWIQHAPPPWTLVPAVIGIVLLIAPRGLPARWLGVIWLLPALLVASPRPRDGEFWFTLLDVGQGLSAVVLTRTHALVYDTGARFSADFDAGSAVLVPFLRHHGIETLDVLVVGHGDNDHVGGARALPGSIAVRRVFSSVPEKLPWWPGEHCRDGQRWRWDGVGFEVLHPPAAAAYRGNDASCVLRVSTAGSTAVLLTGDIERPAEQALLRTRTADLRADIIVVPHHGSRTSSSASFIAAVRPRFALFPVGYRNRWGFPHRDVSERYREAGVRLYDTASHGAITFRVAPAAEVVPPLTHRQSRGRYWHIR